MQYPVQTGKGCLLAMFELEILILQNNSFKCTTTVTISTIYHFDLKIMTHFAIGCRF